MRSVENRINLWARLQWSLAIALVVGLGGFYLLAYRPATRRLADLHAQIEARQRELERNQSRTTNLLILAEHVRRLESQVASYDRQFPRDAQLGAFIKDITHISQQLSLRDWRYAPGLIARRESLLELPIRMQFHGDFGNAASFLRQLEAMQRLTRIRTLNIQARDPRSGTVECELAMSIFFSEG